MIQETYSHSYETLRRSLEYLKAVRSDPDLRGSTIQPAFQAVQQAFQDILNLGLDGLDPAQAANAQSYYTEINKQLRLLSMDVMFLQASRQTATSQQRQQQMSDRLERLLSYCEALLGEDGNESKDDANLR